SAAKYGARSGTRELTFPPDAPGLAAAFLSSGSRAARDEPPRRSPPPNAEALDFRAGHRRGRDAALLGGARSRLRLRRLRSHRPQRAGPRLQARRALDDAVLPQLPDDPLPVLPPPRHDQLRHRLVAV